MPTRRSRPAGPEWMERLLKATSGQARPRGETESFAGPEHLDSEQFFLYAQAQLSGRFGETFTRHERERIEAHLLECEDCMEEFAQVERIVMQQAAMQPPLPPRA